MQWISLEDRLPENRSSGFPILTAGTLSDGREFVNGNMWFDEGKFWEWDAYGSPEQVFNVTHWQELPNHPNQCRKSAPKARDFHKEAALLRADIQSRTLEDGKMGKEV